MEWFHEVKNVTKKVAKQLTTLAGENGFGVHCERTPMGHYDLDFFCPPTGQPLPWGMHSDCFVECVWQIVCLPSYDPNEEFVVD